TPVEASAQLTHALSSWARRPPEDPAARHDTPGQIRDQPMGRDLTHRERISVASVPFVLWGALVAWQFPYATDDPVRREDEMAAFYQLAYSPSIVKDTQLAKDAANARIVFDVAGAVERFVRNFHLERARVLDVGSGSGYLQDVVDDYTGFDIAKT